MAYPVTNEFIHEKAVRRRLAPGVSFKKYNLFNFMHLGPVSHV